MTSLCYGALVDPRFLDRFQLVLVLRRYGNFSLNLCLVAELWSDRSGTIMLDHSHLKPSHISGTYRSLHIYDIVDMCVRIFLVLLCRIACV